ncbi:ORF112R [Turbot reddish body iridovirus]|uniref:ORF112R n=1 Tax=Turbot reddish body iridovirus TaxID=273651 RepID=E2CU57_ISKNV|nr:ORF112R [Turbot reddish body iridovirus]
MSEYVKRHTTKILCHINALHCTLCDVQYIAIKRAYMLRHLKTIHNVEYTHVAAAHDGDEALIMAHMTRSRVIVSNSTRCNICDIVLHSQCVSNLCRHLRIKHPETCDAEWMPSKRVHKPRVSRRSATPHMALVQLLRTMHWPTGVVEAPAFVHFVATVAPKYVLPRKEVRTYKYNTACVLYFFVSYTVCVCVYFPQELLQYFTTDYVQDAPLDLSC